MLAKITLTDRLFNATVSVVVAAVAVGLVYGILVLASL
jgi:hypothetical protein